MTDADLARNQIIEEVIPGSVEKNNKTNLVSFYRRQPKSTWEIPIQYHESTLLFYFFYTIARGVDLVIPGRRKEPLLNLRFLASPLNFFIFLFLIIIVYTLFIWAYFPLFMFQCYKYYNSFSHVLKRILWKRSCEVMQWQTRRRHYWE